MKTTTETIVRTNLSLTNEDIEALHKIYSMIREADCNGIDCQVCPLGGLCDIVADAKNEDEFVVDFSREMKTYQR